MTEPSLAFGWAIISTKDGKLCFSKNGNHYPDEAVLRASLEFMEGKRPVLRKHKGEARSEVIFCWPMTAEINKAMGIETDQTGLLVGFLSDDPDLDSYKGLSIGGETVRSIEMDVTKSVGEPHGKRRIMQEFKIHEVSYVTRPAQEGATLKIIKSADGNDNDVTKANTVEDAEAQFDAYARDLVARTGIPYTAAMRATRIAHPQLFQQMQGHKDQDSAAPPIRKDRDQLAFEAKCDALQLRYPTMSKTEVLRRVRSEYPELLAILRGDDPVTKGSSEQAKAGREFERKVDELRAAWPSMSSREAMRQVRRANPVLFDLMRA